MSKRQDEIMFMVKWKLSFRPRPFEELKRSVSAELFVSQEEVADLLWTMIDDRTLHYTQDDTVELHEDL